MNRYQTPLEVVIKGAIAGMAGAAVLGYLMQKSMEMMQKQQPAPQPEQPSADPKEVLVEKVSTSVFETELPEEQRKSLAQAIHWAYGAFWGAVYAIIQSSLDFPLLLHGIFFGTFVWAFGPLYALPRMKLSPPPEAQPPQQLGMGALLHVAYGLSTAVTFGILSRVGVPGRRQSQKEPED